MKGDEYLESWAVMTRSKKKTKDFLQGIARADFATEVALVDWDAISRETCARVLFEKPSEEALVSYVTANLCQEHARIPVSIVRSKYI